MDNTINISSFLWNICKKYKSKIILFFFSYTILEDVIRIFILPYILKLFGDAYQIGTLTTDKALLWIFIYSILFSMEYITDILLWKYVIYNFNFKIETDFRSKLFSYVVKHSIKYYDNTMAGVISSKINYITNSFYEVVDELCLILSGMIIFFILIIIYSKINIYLSIFLIIWSILFFTTQYILSKFIYKNSKNLTIENNQLSGQITDDFVNISNIKSFSRQKNERLNIKRQSIKILKEESNVMKSKTINNISMYIFTSLLIIFILGFSLKLVFQKNISIGTFLFIGQNIILISFMLNRIFKNIISLIPHISEMKDGFETLLIPVEIKDKENAKKLQINNGKITFKNINFNYKNG